MNRLIFLGTGTSTGVPVLGCDCPVCTSTDPRDKRTRVSVLLQTRKSDSDLWKSVLLDTSIDLRQQLLRHQSPLPDTVVYTHAHVDHFFGLDDLRPVQYYQNKPIDVYGMPIVLERLRQTYSHLFDPEVQQGGGILRINTHLAEGRFLAGPIELLALPVFHGNLPINGYRWGSLAYITDCSSIPDPTWRMMEGIHTLVLNALRHKPHPTHFNLEQALEVVERIRPKQTWFLHMTHDLLHADTDELLPEHVRLAYDGLVVDLEDFDPVNW